MANCFCHFNGYEVKDAAARKAIQELSETVESNKVEMLKNIADRHGYATPQMFGAVGDGVTDDTQAFKDAIAYLEGQLGETDLLTNGRMLYVPSGVYRISDTINVKKSGIAIRGESFGATIITASGFSGVLFRFDSLDGSAIFRNELSNITIRTLKTGDEQPIHIYASKMFYGVLKDLRLVSWYHGIQISSGGKTLLDNVMLFQDQSYEASGIGIQLDGSDIHLNNCQVVPNLDKYDRALEFRWIDGAYLENCHFNGLCRITALTWSGDVGDSCNIQFSNCYFDTSSKDCFHINSTADNSVRNIMFDNCSFMNNAVNQGMVFNTAHKNIGPIMLSNCVIGNCGTGIRGNAGTLLNISNCNFHNCGEDSIVLSSPNNIITGSRFYGSPTRSAILASGTVVTGSIISLCNFSGITTGTKLLQVPDTNTIVNNVGL